MPLIRQGKGQTTEMPDRQKADAKRKTPGGERGRPWARRSDTQGHLRKQGGLHSSWAPPRGPEARLNSQNRALQSERWQELKWEKVEAAEVALVETSIFTLVGRQVSRGFE